MTALPPSDDLKRKNARMLGVTLACVAVMAGLAFASVPLYRMICQVTGWGGTTQVVDSNTSQVMDREITVRFDSAVARDMPWTFRPEAKDLTVKIGQDGFVSFLAHNNTGVPITGTAVYNVTPLKAGKYFFKTECFCFGQQTLAPEETAHMPVSFFVDPAINEDRELRDLETITLSYTFFRHDSAALDKAIEKFGRDFGGTPTN